MTHINQHEDTIERQKPEPCAAKNKPQVETTLNEALGTMLRKAAGMCLLAVGWGLILHLAYLQLQKRFITLAIDVEEQLWEWRVSAPNMVADDSDWIIHPAGDGINHLSTWLHVQGVWLFVGCSNVGFSHEIAKAFPVLRLLSLAAYSVSLLQRSTASWDALTAVDNEKQQVMKNYSSSLICSTGVPHSVLGSLVHRRHEHTEVSTAENI